MPKRNDTLHELIKKMTPSEKRYFKLFVKGTSSISNNKYIQLFDSISRQANYNEQALVKKFDYQKNPNSLSVAKNYLFQLILKCLRNYESNKSLDTEFIGLIQDSQSLYSRGLFGATQKVLSKAHKLVDTAKRQDLLIALCDWERRLVEEVSEPARYVENYEVIMEKERNASYTLEVNTSLYTQYKKLQFHNLREGNKKRSKTRDLFFQLMQHPLLDEKKLPDKASAQLYYWMCYFEYHIGMRNRKQAFDLAVKIRNHFKKYPFLIEFDKESYVICLGNYLLFMLEMGEVTVFQEEVIRFKNLQVGVNNHHLERRKEIDYFSLMMMYYEVTGNYKEATEGMIPEIKAYFENHKHSLIDHEEFLLKNTAAWILIVSGEVKEAAIWLSYLDNEINRNSFLDFFVVCRILLLVVHYTLKNYQLVESIAKSTVRILETKNKFSSTDAFLLKFFKKAGAADDVKEKQTKLLKQLKEDIETIYLYVDDTPPYRLDGILAWVDSLLKNKPMMKIIKENNEKERKNAIRTGKEIKMPAGIGFIIRRGN